MGPIVVIKRRNFNQSFAPAHWWRRKGYLIREGERSYVREYGQALVCLRRRVVVSNIVAIAKLHSLRRLGEKHKKCKDYHLRDLLWRYGRDYTFHCTFDPRLGIPFCGYVLPPSWFDIEWRNYGKSKA